MANLDKIFKKDDPHEVLLGIREHIDSTKCGHSEPYESYSKRLSEGERIVVLISMFVLEVANGGLAQFLSNSSGDLTEEVRSAMDKIGATTALAALDDVRKEIFDGLPIPTDRETRCDILIAWEEDDEDRAEKFYKKHRLGWCEPVEEAVVKYIRSHKEMFT